VRWLAFAYLVALVVVGPWLPDVVLVTWSLGITAGFVVG
jgi:hypothetical protein